MLKSGDTIFSTNHQLRYIGTLLNNSVVSFELVNNHTVLPLHLSLGAYMHPSNQSMMGKAAGHYIFKPIINDRDAYLTNSTDFTAMYQRNYTFL
jgi:hypothetical protein